MLSTAEKAEKPEKTVEPCHYCGKVGGHEIGCPAALGTEADCKKELCAGCTFVKGCKGPKPPKGK